jgi:hypothetical protein
MQLTIGTDFVESVTSYIGALKVRKRQTQVSGREHREVIRNLRTNYTREDEAH